MFRVSEWYQRASVGGSEMALYEAGYTKRVLDLTGGRSISHAHSRGSLAYMQRVSGAEILAFDTCPWTPKKYLVAACRRGVPERS